MLNLPIDTFSVTMGMRPAFKPDNQVLGTRGNLDILPPSELAVHGHPYYEATYVIDSDNFTTYINDTPLVIKKNLVYFKVPNTLHPATNRLSGFQRGISVRFRVNSPEWAMKLGNHPFFFDCNEEMRNMFLAFAPYAKEEPLNKTILNTQVSELLDAILSTPGIQYINGDCNMQDDNFIGLIRYMYNHISESMTLADLAAKVHLHPTYFSKKFKAIYKITPMNYLYSVKLFRSLDELAFSNKSISSIAESIGFGHTAAFCSAFKRAYGISPGEYREATKRNGHFVVV